LDKDESVKRPTNEFSYEKAHRDFYDQVYHDGIQHARELLTRYASWLKDNMGSLPKDVQDQVAELAGGDTTVLDQYCAFVPREGW
jgi:hypothetical protein